MQIRAAGNNTIMVYTANVNTIETDYDVKDTFVKITTEKTEIKK